MINNNDSCSPPCQCHYPSCTTHLHSLETNDSTLLLTLLYILFNNSAIYLEINTKICR